MTGVKHARHPFIALIDSDNILPHPTWLRQMITPLLRHTQAVGSEPWEYTYRPSAGFIERYSSLTGVNDPYALFVGNFDRQGILHPWTTLPIKQQDFPDYCLATLTSPSLLPTIGANGTIFRSSFLLSYLTSNFFFDIDILAHALTDRPQIQFIKVKTGIIHTFCESSLSKFVRKQTRRIKDLFYYQPIRQSLWTQKRPLLSLVYQNFLYFFYVNTLVFPLAYSIRGFISQPDIAWFFHPFASLLTFWIYTYYSLLHLLGVKLSQSRSKWHQ